MLVTELFMIGKTTMPSSWVALIAAFIVAYAVVRFKYGKKVGEQLVDAIFYFIIVWKLSVIVTDFGSVIKSPLSIVYFHGGLVGFYLGLLAAGISILKGTKKKGLVKADYIALFVGFVTIQAVFQVMMVLLNEGTFGAEVVTIVIFTVFTSYMLLTVQKIGLIPSQLVLLFIATHFFVAAFQPAGVVGTSVLTTLFVGLFFMALFSWGPVLEVESESEGHL